MADSKQEWSSEELKSLLNQALALEFIKLKRGEKEKKTESWWKTLLNSTVAATVVTIVLGTFGGNFIANKIQERNKANDDARAQADAAKIERQRTVEEALTTAVKTVVASQEIIDISGNSWDETMPLLRKESREDIILQKRDIWKAYNSAIGEWRLQRERLGLLLQMRNENPAKVREMWGTLTTAVNLFASCAVTYNKKSEGMSLSQQDVSCGCALQRGTMRNALGDLTKLTVPGLDGKEISKVNVNRQDDTSCR